MHDAVRQLSQLSSWVHPQRQPDWLQSLSQSGQNRALLSLYSLTLPPLDQINAATSRLIIDLWPQLSRLCLLVGSLGHLGQIFAMRIFPRYLPTDLRLIQTLSLQLYPYGMQPHRQSIDIAILQHSGWATLCQLFTLSPCLHQLGMFALPPIDTSGHVLLPTPSLPRLKQSVSKIIDWLPHHAGVEKI